jgi:hypothetical protein
MSDETIPGAGVPPPPPVFTPVAPAPPAKTKVKTTVRRQAVVVKTDPVTDVKTTTDVITDVVVDETPATATLAAPYAYYDDDGKLNSWAAGQVLVDADEIASLIERGAIFTAE